MGKKRAYFCNHIGLFLSTLLPLLLFISGCQLFSSPDVDSSDASGDKTISSIRIREIYIQSFTGQQVEQVQEVFFETVTEQDVFSFMELLPDDYTDLKVLRLEVVDYSIWENEEKYDADNPDHQSVDSSADLIKRRNALISIRVALFEAETGRLLLRKLYTQPFQQIYVGADEVNNLPEKTLELKRLTKILIFKILTDFYQAVNEKMALDLEEGQGQGFISRTFHNLGDSRIKKGNRLARAGDFERAIWMWQLVLFRPEEAEPLNIYKMNRASAYYNLGTLYSQMGEWLKAARMYSMANRMQQKLKYAQAWGNSMQKWLEIQKGVEGQVDNLSQKTKIQDSFKIIKSKKKTEQKEELKESDILKNLENNEQLLLKPRELWPLEPALKFSEPLEPVVEEPVIIDEPLPDATADAPEEQINILKSEPGDDLIRKIPGSSSN